MLRNAFESYQISLQEQKTNVNNFQTEIANLDVNKLHEYNLYKIMNTMSSSACDKIINHPKPGFKPHMEFSIGNIILSDGNLEGDASSFPSCSDISIQTDFSEDSDTEWFDAEGISMDDLIESSSDEVTDEYPINVKLKQDINLVKKIVPISEKDAWIIANRKLLKIVDHSLKDDVYADKVDDIVVLKDGCVLILCVEQLFIMKLLPNRRLVRFAGVGSKHPPYSYSPYCFCITEDDSLIIYLWSKTNYEMYGCYHNRIIVLYG
ncbi:unnamed protein product [Mytilus coruscus]|uniref:Uncharacterized protein n=1 Tax=Mytilus coruscus TaxID=42192 RepID=A0A6J8AZH6_MYTCO|nr:unnamed protein product [Mytilus coruscus]